MSIVVLAEPGAEPASAAFVKETTRPLCDSKLVSADFRSRSAANAHDVLLGAQDGRNPDGMPGRACKLPSVGRMNWDVKEAIVFVVAGLTFQLRCNFSCVGSVSPGKTEYENRICGVVAGA